MGETMLSGIRFRNQLKTSSYSGFQPISSLIDSRAEPTHRGFVKPPSRKAGPFRAFSDEGVFLHKAQCRREVSFCLGLTQGRPGAGEVKSSGRGHIRSSTLPLLSMMR
jgi:hypothetical protein